MTITIISQCEICGKKFRRYPTHKTKSISWKQDEGIRINKRSFCNKCWDKIFSKIIKELDYIREEELSLPNSNA